MMLGASGQRKRRTETQTPHIQIVKAPGQRKRPHHPTSAPLSLHLAFDAVPQVEPFVEAVRWDTRMGASPIPTFSS